MFDFLKSTKKTIAVLFAIAIVIGFFIGKVEPNSFYQLTTLVIGTYIGFSINAEKK